MTPFTIGIVGQKGGCGKTTTGAHLASYWHLQGLNVGIVDCDPQGSMLKWNGRRVEGSRLDGLAVTSRPDKCPQGAYRDIASRFDVCIFDGPARLGPITKQIARFVDVVVVPIQPTQVDLDIAHETLEFITEADVDRIDDGRDPVRRCIVVTRAVVNSTEAKTFPDVVRDYGHFIGIMHQRLEYHRAWAAGETAITAFASGPADMEVRRIADAIGLPGKSVRRTA
jgi:cellulose biosynthesis protein BcsQ